MASWSLAFFFIFTVSPVFCYLGKKGDIVVLNCTIDLDSGIKWFLNNESIANSKAHTFEGKSVLFKLEKNTIGEYYCLSPEGEPIDHVDVECQPYADNDSKVTKNAIYKETFVFDCKGFGNPQPEAMWLNNSKPLELGPRVILKSNIDEKGKIQMINNSLRIQPVEYEDEGVYTCIGVNKYGNLSIEVEVHVKDKFAAMWPFLGICLEVAILCIVIFIYEKRRTKKASLKEAAATPEEADKLNQAKNGDDVRQRK